MRKHNFSPTPWIIALLAGAVLVPTVLSIAIGIVSLALYESSHEIVTGILIICFAVLVLGGAISSIVLVSKWHRLTRLQADFMSNISHELKTPLTSIRIFAETLKMGRVTEPEEIQTYLNIVTEEADKLTNMINQILLWRQIEVGKNLYVRKLERVEDLVGDAIQPFSMMEKQGSVKVRLEIEGEVAPVWVDRKSMGEAIQNVVHNAVKYGGSEGIVKVRVRMRGSSRVAIEVKDHGPGIAQEEQKKIFDQFYRSEASRADATVSGSGLGLSISRNIVQAHGGTINLSSHEGWGSIFTIIIPAAQGKQLMEQASVGAGVGAGVGVDDDGGADGVGASAGAVHYSDPVEVDWIGQKESKDTKAPAQAPEE